jgi:hypothetical protein
MKERLQEDTLVLKKDNFLIFDAIVKRGYFYFNEEDTKKYVIITDGRRSTFQCSIRKKCGESANTISRYYSHMKSGCGHRWSVMRI